MAQALEITGNLRDRFVQAAVLLQTLGPVHEESAELHTLDQDFSQYEIGADHENFLKQRFLDSFALICSTEKDSARVSAACLEEGSPEGTIIRVASNGGVTEHTLRELRDLVDVLNSTIADGTRLSHLASVQSRREANYFQGPPYATRNMRYFQGSSNWIILGSYII